MKRHKMWNKEYIYDFQRYKAMRFFGYSIYTRKANIAEVEEDQSNLLKNIVEFNNKSRPRSKGGKDKDRWNISIETIARKRIGNINF